jgi:hypothetical protein
VYRTDEQRAEGAVSLAWTQAAVTDEVKAYLRTLEDHFVLKGAKGEILAVHGSPRRRLAAEYPYPAILFGHTHVPYARPVGATTFVNVGSGGRPKDGDWRACYAMVDPARLGEGAGFVEFVRVAYDYELLQRELAATPLITSFSAPAHS